MKKELIVKDIYELIEGITGTALSSECQSLPLLSTKCNMEPRELVYLLLLVQDKYNIKISEEEIINNKFSTIKLISEVVYKEINGQ
jgi:peptide maturation system acyl carrier-related protein